MSIAEVKKMLIILDYLAKYFLHKSLTPGYKYSGTIIANRDDLTKELDKYFKKQKIPFKFGAYEDDRSTIVEFVFKEHPKIQKAKSIPFEILMKELSPQTLAIIYMLRCWKSTSPFINVLGLNTEELALFRKTLWKKFKTDSRIKEYTENGDPFIITIVEKDYRKFRALIAPYLFKSYER
jgi:hypothetical protein